MEHDASATASGLSHGPPVPPEDGLDGQHLGGSNGTEDAAGRVHELKLPLNSPPRSPAPSSDGIDTASTDFLYFKLDPNDRVFEQDPELKTFRKQERSIFHVIAAYCFQYPFLDCCSSRAHHAGRRRWIRNKVIWLLLVFTAAYGFINLLKYCNYSVHCTPNADPERWYLAGARASGKMITILLLICLFTMFKLFNSGLNGIPSYATSWTSWRHIHVTTAVIAVFAGILHAVFHVLRTQHLDIQSRWNEVYSLVTGAILMVGFGLFVLPYFVYKCVTCRESKLVMERRKRGGRRPTVAGGQRRRPTVAGGQRKDEVKTEPTPQDPSSVVLQVDAEAPNKNPTRLQQRQRSAAASNLKETDTEDDEFEEVEKSVKLFCGCCRWVEDRDMAKRPRSHGCQRCITGANKKLMRFMHTKCIVLILILYTLHTYHIWPIFFSLLYWMIGAYNTVKSAQVYYRFVTKHQREDGDRRTRHAPKEFVDQSTQGYTLELVFQTQDRNPVEFGLYYKIKLGDIAGSFTMIPVRDTWVYTSKGHTQAVNSLEDGDRLVAQQGSSWRLSHRESFIMFRIKQCTMVSRFNRMLKELSDAETLASQRKILKLGEQDYTFWQVMDSSQIDIKAEGPYHSTDHSIRGAKRVAVISNGIGSTVADGMLAFAQHNRGSFERLFIFDRSREDETNQFFQFQSPTDDGSFVSITPNSDANDAMTVTVQDLMDPNSRAGAAVASAEGGGIAKIRMPRVQDERCWIKLIQQLADHNFEIVVCSKYCEKAIQRWGVNLKNTKRRVHLEEFSL